MTFAVTLPLISFAAPALAPWVSVDGVDTLVAEKHDTPLVTFILTFRGGSYSDPQGKEGLANLTGDLLLRGTKKKTREQIENELDFLGASLAVDAGFHSLQIRGHVLRKNLDRLIVLLEEILLEPTFPEEALSKLREETISQLYLRLENDGRLAKEKFTELMFKGHPYGRDPTGTKSSLTAITRADIQEAFLRHFTQTGFLAAAAGDIDRPAFEGIVRRLLVSIPKGESPSKPVPFKSELSGIDVLIVDKPERSQTQFFIGHPGISVMDPDFFALSVFLNAFGGGMFQAQYLQEIRVKRGWAYGAYASLDTRRDGGMVYFHTYPAVKDTLPAIQLSLELWKKAIEADGIADQQLEFSKTYLLRSFPFQIDTPEKVISEKSVNRMIGRPDDYIEKYVQTISSITPKMAREAAKKHLRAGDLKLVILCTAKDFRETLGKEIGAKTVNVVPFDKM